MSTVMVAGGANIDIVGRSFAPLVAADSNPGQLSFSLGGVAFNLAANLNKLDCPVSFMTVFAKDQLGNQAAEYCKKCGIDLAASQYAPGRMSTYLAIEGPNGDMSMALSDMAIVEQFDAALASVQIEKLSQDDYLVLDTNLQADDIETLVLRMAGRIYLDPVSTTKAHKAAKLLSHLTLIKPNRLEAEALSGLPLRKKEDWRPMLDFFRKSGTAQVIISLGENGLIAADHHRYFHFQTPVIKAVNATGAGDALLSGFVSGQYHGLDFRESLILGMAAAQMALQATLTVNPNLDYSSAKSTAAKLVEQLAVTEI
jgi:pseudouridine kinase